MLSHMPPRWIFLLIGFAIGATLVSRVGNLGVGRYQALKAAQGIYVVDTTTGEVRALEGREGVPFEKLGRPEEGPGRTSRDQ